MIELSVAKFKTTFISNFHSYSVIQILLVCITKNYSTTKKVSPSKITGDLKLGRITIKLNKN